LVDPDFPFASQVMLRSFHRLADNLIFDDPIGLSTKPLETSSKCLRLMQLLHILGPDLIPIDVFEANPSLAFTQGFVDAGTTS
jgi:hypothetical protein